MQVRDAGCLVYKVGQALGIESVHGPVRKNRQALNIGLLVVVVVVQRNSFDPFLNAMGMELGKDGHASHVVINNLF